MAYRRKQGITRATTFKEDIYHQTHLDDVDGGSLSAPSFKPSHSFSYSNSSLAAQAIRASSAAHRDSSAFDHPRSQGFNAYEDASRNESKGFWGILAQKAKAILDDDNVLQQFGVRSSTDSSTGAQPTQSYLSNDGFSKVDNPTFRKSLAKLTSSLNQIGDTFEKAFEEGWTIVENKTADIIQDARKLQTRRKGTGAIAEVVESQASGGNSPWQESLMQPAPENQTNHETQLKASRDVAMATAAKAKLLLRELKTVKADLAFAKERCSQLEKENRRLRESREKGSNPADDDLIRLQLETLLAEKARLAHENSIYTRENRFLREIVEYHQLTMQDVVYIDEGIEEVTEVYPSITRTLSVTPPSPLSPVSPSELPQPASSPVTKEICPVSHQILQEQANDVSRNGKQQSSATSVPEKNDVKRKSESSKS